MKVITCIHLYHTIAYYITNLANEFQRWKIGRQFWPASQNIMRLWVVLSSWLSIKSIDCLYYTWRLISEITVSWLPTLWYLETWISVYLGQFYNLNWHISGSSTSLVYICMLQIIHIPTVIRNHGGNYDPPYQL